MPSKNVADIKSRVARLLRDKGITSVDDQDYIDGINQAQDTLCEMLKLWQKRTITDSISGTQQYPLPSDYMALIDENSVEYIDSDGVKTTLNKEEIENIQNQEDLYTETGTPTAFWFDGDKINFAPIPDYNGSNNIIINHYRYVEELAGGTAPRNKVITVTENYTLTELDDIVLADSTLTLTLPDATTNANVEFTLKNIGTGTVTVSPVLSQTIDEDATYGMMTQFETIRIISDGSNWQILARY